MLRVFLTVAVLGFSAPSIAQLAQPMIYGPGSLTCADFLNASRGAPFGQHSRRTEADRALVSENAYFLGYALGYASAYNVLGITNIRDLSMSGFDAEMRNYCSANPSTNFIEAVILAWNKVGKQR